MLWKNPWEKKQGNTPCFGDPHGSGIIHVGRFLRLTDSMILNDFEWTLDDRKIQVTHSLDFEMVQSNHIIRPLPQRWISDDYDIINAVIFRGHMSHKHIRIDYQYETHTHTHTHTHTLSSFFTYLALAKPLTSCILVLLHVAIGSIFNRTLPTCLVDSL